MIIEKSISPNSYRREELQVGQMIDGKFVQERGLWEVRKDSRLKTFRKYSGTYGKADNVHHYTVEVPADYPLTIVRMYKTGHGLTSVSTEYEILYTPATAEEKEESPSLSDGDTTLDFGKHEGSKLSDCPVSYLKWLASHKEVMSKEHQWASESAKAVLASLEIAVVAKAA
jgi:hypothetical protein